MRIKQCLGWAALVGVAALSGCGGGSNSNARTPNFQPVQKDVSFNQPRNGQPGAPGAFGGANTNLQQPGNLNQSGLQMPATSPYVNPNAPASPYNNPNGLRPLPTTSPTTSHMNPSPYGSPTQPFGAQPQGASPYANPPRSNTSGAIPTSGGLPPATGPSAPITRTTAGAFDVPPPLPPSNYGFPANSPPPAVPLQ